MDAELLFRFPTHILRKVICFTFHCSLQQHVGMDACLHTHTCITRKQMN